MQKKYAKTLGKRIYVWYTDIQPGTVNNTLGTCHKIRKTNKKRKNP
jgi:hypothetical protein